MSSPIIEAFRKLQEDLAEVKQRLDTQQRSVEELRSVVEAARGKDGGRQSLEAKTPTEVGDDTYRARLVEDIRWHVANTFAAHRVPIAYSVLSAVYHKRARRCGFSMRELLAQMENEKLIYPVLTYRGITLYLPKGAETELDAVALEQIRATGARSKSELEQTRAQQAAIVASAMNGTRYALTGDDLDVARQLGILEEK